MPKELVVFLVLGLALALALAVVATRPRLPIETVVVVVDAGHGGSDPGALAAGVQEKDVNLAIALRVQRKAQAVPGLQVILTRSSDVYPALLDRVRLAEETGAKLYVSIHANYYRDPQVCGVETWTDSSAHTESLRLAREVQRAVVAAVRAADRGVHRQTLYLRHTSLPAALVEVGYLSCPAERAKLLDPAYQERIAEGILQGILTFLSAP